MLGGSFILDTEIPSKFDGLSDSLSMPVPVVNHYQVKLADVLGKFILPVNFLDQWPPECLAIQFATTQFVPWKPPNEGMEVWLCTANGAFDWILFLHFAVETDSVNNNSALEQLELDHRRVAEVANRLAERLHAEFLTMGSISPGSSGSLVRKISMLRSCPCKLPPDLNQLSQPREGSPMVLISLHPQEKAVVRALCCHCLTPLHSLMNL